MKFGNFVTGDEFLKPVLYMELTISLPKVLAEELQKVSKQVGVNPEDMMLLSLQESWQSSIPSLLIL